MKKVVIGLVALMLLFSISMPALATSDTPPLSEISPNLDFSAGSWSPLMLRSTSTYAFSYLYFGISKVSSTSVYVTATTQTNKISDCVSQVMYLQKWVDGAWTTVRNRGSYGYSVDEISDSTTWTVDTGYYYRLRTVHSGDLGLDYISKYSYTGSILVN